MSFSDVQRFHERVRQDFAFFQLFDEALRNGGPPSVVAFARSHGFEFSLEDYLMFNNGVNGSTQNTVARLSVGVLERLFIWLAGASPKILASCPESEQKRQASLGGAILITALFASVMASILLHTLNFSPVAIIFGALVWATIILLMDHALLSTYNHSGSWFHKAWQFLLRFLIAFLIAVTVAHPVVLKLFSERITTAYEQGALAQKRSELDKACDKNDPQSDIARRKTEMDTAESKILGTNPDDNFQEPKSCNAEDAGMVSEDTVLTRLKESLRQMTDRKQQFETEASELIDQSNREERGEPGPGMTGVASCGSVCRTLRQQANEKRGVIARIDHEIADLGNQIARRQSELGRLTEQERRDKMAQCQKQKEEMRQAVMRTRENQEGVLQNHYASLLDQYKTASNLCLVKQEQIDKLKPDILTQTEILHDLIFQEDGIAWDKLFLFLTFMLLFMAIDMLAVTLKMAGGGIYEVKADIEEYANATTAFSQVRHTTVLHFSSLSAEQQEHLDDLPEGNRKAGLRANLEKLTALFVNSDAVKLQMFFRHFVAK